MAPPRFVATTWSTIRLYSMRHLGGSRGVFGPNGRFLGARATPTSTDESNRTPYVSPMASDVADRLPRVAYFFTARYLPFYREAVLIG